VLAAGEFELGLESPDGVTAAALDSGDAVVVLDTEVTDELAREGLARDVVRHVQQARRDADLVVTDRIHLAVDGDPAVVDAVRVHEDHVSTQVLAVEVAAGPLPDGDDVVEATIEGHALRFRITLS
jgi:isoleucyl-tRNA synthetase